MMYLTWSINKTGSLPLCCVLYILILVLLPVTQYVWMATISTSVLSPVRCNIEVSDDVGIEFKLEPPSLQKPNQIWNALQSNGRNRWSISLEIRPDTWDIDLH